MGQKEGSGRAHTASRPVYAPPGPPPKLCRLASNASSSRLETPTFPYQPGETARNRLTGGSPGCRGTVDPEIHGATRSPMPIHGVHFFFGIAA
jgi:hypothetical protein